MSSRGETLEGSTLLRNLAHELGRLAESSDQAQRPPPDTGAATADIERVRHFMMQVQTLDSLSQALRDLQRLASAAADTCNARHALDAEFIRGHVVLQSLADRLILGPQQGEAAHPAGFLL